MGLQRFPGFIDAHVHLREPGATHKEDFYTGSRAAVKGGFTFIIDMPNNPIPTVTLESLQDKIHLSQKAVCDIGFHFGTQGKNIDLFSKIWDNTHVFGLKIYCNHTTGDLLIEDVKILEKIFKAWKSEKPILVHAEQKTLELVLELSHKYSRRLHVCHIARCEEVDMVRTSKKKGLLVSVGVTSHHLFLTSSIIKNLGSLALMKPELGTQKDQDALWEGILNGTIDLVETDHAPHTLGEKQSEKPPFGVRVWKLQLGYFLKQLKKKD